MTLSSSQPFWYCYPFHKVMARIRLLLAGYRITAEAQKNDCLEKQSEKKQAKLKPIQMRNKNLFKCITYLNTFFYWQLWEVSSGPQSTDLLVQQAENSTSGWGSLLERPPNGSRFSKSLFWDVSGTVPESVRTCGFKINSSNFDRAPKLAVLLNSWDSFLLTLPSISSETCVK